MEWRTDIENAPRDGANVLVFGLPTSIEGCEFSRRIVLTAYWDDIDGAWCATTSTWLGPFVNEIKYWMPLPPPPPA